MSRTLRILLGVLSLGVIFTSCREPMSRETFRSGTGPFEFEVLMTDTSMRYDFTFYTRIDASRDHLGSFSGRNITVRWTSPSDSLYEETVFMPMLDSSAGFYSRQVVVPYRSGVLPVEPGVWKMRVTVDSASTVPGLRGLGLVFRKRRAE